MEYTLPQQKHTPYIKISGQEGLIELKGSSNGENAFKLFEDAIVHVKSYKSDKKKIIINVSMEYFNTSSAKCIYDIFKSVEQLSAQGYSAEVNWHYNFDDEDMKLTGEDYADLCNLTFNFRELV